MASAERAAKGVLRTTRDCMPKQENRKYLSKKLKSANKEILALQEQLAEEEQQHKKIEKGIKLITIRPRKLW